MLRKTLLVTTALVLGASVAYAGQKHFSLTNSKAAQKLLTIGHPGSMVKGLSSGVVTSARGTKPVHNVTPHLDSAVFSNFSKSANGQYISWYGFRAEAASSCYTSSIYHSCIQVHADNALAFTPAASVTTKKTTVAMFSYFPSATYAVNIYSDAAGLPGATLATSKTFSDSDTGLCCTAVRTVGIKANLTAGTTYFLGLVGSSAGSNGGWNMEDTNLSGSAVDYYHYKEHLTYNYGTGTHSTNYSSPWHASTYYPETGVASLK